MNTDSSALVQQMGIGMFLRPLECDGVYLLGPAPDHIDPLYECMRLIGAEFHRLIVTPVRPLDEDHLVLL